jgi:hypothetical protein
MQYKQVPDPASSSFMSQFINEQRTFLHSHTRERGMRSMVDEMRVSTGLLKLNLW